MKHRTLSREERKIWAHVQRSVTPFAGRFILEPAPAAEPAPAVPPAPPAKSGASAQAARAKPQPPPLPALAPIEPQIMRRIRRGGRAHFDGVLDLHGLTQAKAHAALGAFLFARQAQGARLVIIITGKGGAGPALDPDRERGVLRRMVPHWLRLPDMRAAVLGFETAAAHHGGDGAFYVRLRRARGA